MPAAAAPMEFNIESTSKLTAEDQTSTTTIEQYSDVWDNVAISSDVEPSQNGTTSSGQIQFLIDKVKNVIYNQLLAWI